MKLSVVIPVHNGADCIGVLLDSLRPQRAADIELLAVDDASTDATAAVLARYPDVRVLHHAQNRGAGAARNTGAQAAQGEIVLFLDADTEATPGLLAAVTAFFAGHPEVAAASGVYCERNCGTHGFARYLDICEAAMRSAGLDGPAPGALSGSLCAVRRAVLLTSGGFSTERALALEDVELGLRLARAGHAHWLVGAWRVRHRQPRAAAYCRELVPRTRHYLALLRQFGTFNEVMGGRAEGWARLTYAIAGVLALAWLLVPSIATAGACLLAGGLALWRNRGWLALCRQREGWGFLPAALGWHVATTGAICLGGLLGAGDALKSRLWRHAVDLAVVGAYLRSLLTPGAGGYLIQFLTHRCPAHCGHCFDHPQRAAIGRADELDLARIRRIAAAAGPLGHVSLTGGEPLLRDDLGEILQAWYAAGVRSISLSTSAAYPEKLAAVLARALPQLPWLRLIVTVSVDAPGARHDALRGMPGLFGKVEETLSRLQTLRARWPQLRVHACLTLSAANAATAEATLDWLARWHCDQIELNALRGVPSAPTFTAAPPASYDRLRAQVARRNGAAAGLAWLFARLDNAMFAIVRQWRAPWPCGGCLAGRRLAVIQADGTVLPCEMLRTTRPADAAALGDFTLGRLADHGDDLQALLAGAQARRVVDYIAATDCRCSFECAIFATLAYRPWRLPRLLLRGTRPRDARQKGLATP